MQQKKNIFLSSLQVRFTLHLAYFLNSIFSQPVIPHRSSNTKCGHCKSESFGCSYSQGALEQNSEHNSIQDKQSSIEKEKIKFFLLLLDKSYPESMSKVYVSVSITNNFLKLLSHRFSHSKASLH